MPRLISASRYFSTVLLCIWQVQLKCTPAKAKLRGTQQQRGNWNPTQISWVHPGSSFNQVVFARWYRVAQPDTEDLCQHHLRCRGDCRPLVFGWNLGCSRCTKCVRYPDCRCHWHPEKVADEIWSCTIMYICIVKEYVWSDMKCITHIFVYSYCPYVYTWL